MVTLAIIPARGGSKSVYKKSIALLGGKPLLAYTIEAARRARRVDRVVLTTDDAEIAAVGRQYGVEVPIMRPPELARDHTLMLPVLQHMLTWLKKDEGYAPEIMVLLQPTSPLRQGRHIDEALEVLVTTDADSVVSVVEVPHQYNPVSVLEIVDGALEPFLPGEGGRIQRRQEKPRVYARNGPAVYCTWTRRLFMPDAHLYAGVCRPYVMDARHSVDIDTREDLAQAELALATQVQRR